MAEVATQLVGYSTNKLVKFYGIGLSYMYTNKLNRLVASYHGIDRMYYYITLIEHTLTSFLFELLAVIHEIPPLI